MSAPAACGGGCTQESELLWAEQRVGEVCGKAHRDDRAEHEVEHGHPHVLDAQRA
jgi:hypothetical protein